MKHKRAAFFSFIIVALLALALFANAGLRVRADNYVLGFVRDLYGYLDVDLANASGSLGDTNGYLNVDIAAQSLNPVAVSVANPTGVGQNSSGTGAFIPVCDSSAVINVSTSGETQLVALSTGKTIHVCAYNLMANGAVNVNLAYGTGSNCASNTTALTGQYPLQAQAGVSAGSGTGVITQTAASNALCVNLSASISVQGLVTYGTW